MPLDQKQTIIVLVAAFVGVIAVSMVVLLVLPDASAPVSEDALQSPATGVSTSATGFNLGVLDRTGYKMLDQTPIQNGALPVLPPPTTGKANPFL